MAWDPVTQAEDQGSRSLICSRLETLLLVLGPVPSALKGVQSNTREEDTSNRSVELKRGSFSLVFGVPAN